MSAGTDDNMTMVDSELEGIFWPCATDGDDSLPWVERADDSDRFKDDEEAARALAKLTGTRVMFAEASGGLSPFVFAFPDSNASNDQNLVRGVDGFYQPALSEKWNKEAEERFGSRRDRYDEAMDILRFRVGTRVRVKASARVFAGKEGEVSGREEHSRWVVFDGEKEGTQISTSQLEEINDEGRN